jgi:eukaryotic-like serine/threonine-protein kinase
VLPGVLIADRFEIEGRAGTGGMAIVYRAIDKQTSAAVALKVMAPELMTLERFHREAQALARLDHTGVVRYVAHGTTLDGQCYLAMEWLDGEALSSRLGRAPLEVAEAVTITLRVAEILSSAHQSGVVHRDIKPSNLFLVDGDVNRVKLLDFGIARVGLGHTRTGFMIGTPGYMAPEQTRGDDVTPRADIFSLGCVFFECLTGRPPFSGDHAMAVLVKILLEEAPRASLIRPGVPAEIDTLLQRMLAKEDSERPDADEVIAALSTMAPSVGVRQAIVERAALTDGEQRLMCVILARPPQAEIVDLAHLRAAVASYGGRVDALADGSAVCALSRAGVATDQAAHAARCALALRALLPDAAMALASGRAAAVAQGSLGQVIDRAAAILRAGRGVQLDEVTASLLDARFELGGDAGGLALVGERDAAETTRTLLGRPTPFVGRDRELATLEAIAAECFHEPVARVVLLVGGAGTGKSRVRYELLHRLEQRHPAPEVLLARGDQLRSGSPFGLLAPALRRAAGILDGEDITVRRAKLRARVSRHAPAQALGRLTTYLGELAGVPAPDTPELLAARRDPPVMGDLLREAWSDFLTAECAARPMVIVLEDVQWGDLPTVKMIDTALQACRDLPLLVVALARPEVRDHFPHLWEERGVQEIRLGELTRKASERLVRDVLGDKISAAQLERLVTLSDGNAFYLEELIRAVADGKDVDALPETVLAMVQARLDRLEPEARRVLRAAAVFGQVSWRGGVSALLGTELHQHQLRDLFATLREREIVTRRPEARFPGEEEYVFRHALVREAAYAALTEDDRRLGHRLAGEWLEQSGEDDAVVLAEHFERGGEEKRALRWYRRGAEQALEGNDLQAALNLARRGVDLGASAELGTLRLIEAEALGWRGEWSEALASATEAMSWIEAGTDGWYAAVVQLVLAAARVGSIDRLVALGQRLRDGGVATSDRQAVAMARAVNPLILAGQLHLGEELIARLAGARPADAASRAFLEDARGVHALFTGDLGRYLEQKQLVVDAFKAAGQERHESLQRARLGYACMLIGDYRRAVDELRASLAQAERMGLGQVRSLAKHNLGMALALLDEKHLPEARAHEQTALDAFVAQGDTRLEGASRLYLAEILTRLGDLPAAEAEVTRAVAVTRAGSPVWGLCVAMLAEVRLAAGRNADALESARQAHELLEKLGGIDEGESLVRLVHAQALAATGDLDGARVAIRAARDRLLARAAKITDERLRAGFLESVPENARTLALARQLLP